MPARGNASRMEAVLPILRRLRAECASAAPDALDLALTTVCTLLTNVLEKPEEDKFRTVRLGNATFNARVGRFPAALELLRSFGFEDATQGPDPSAAPTHLALPVADAPTLARGLVLVEAARQAAELVLADSSAAGNRGGGGSSGGSSSAASGSSSNGASSSSAQSRAEGKRPMGAQDGAAEKRRRVLEAALAQYVPEAGGSTAGGCGSSSAAAGAPAAKPPDAIPELEDFSAAAIDAHFAAALGGEDGSGVGALGEAAFARLVGAARDAHSVGLATGDSEAQGRAVHWLTLLLEHGALLGWEVETAAAEGEADSEGAAADGEASAGGAGEAPEGQSSSAVLEEATLEEDGNFDECAVCGLGGELFCCEACPQAYHGACLLSLGAAEAPEDDDRAWFCPPCARQLGIGEASA